MDDRGYYIKVETRTQQEYQYDDKEKLLEQIKKYRETYIERIKKSQCRYYSENREDLLSKDKQYREGHKERIRENNQNRYQQNKEQILTRQKERTGCECGANVARSDVTRYRRTLKHQQMMDKLNAERYDQNVLSEP